MIYTHLRTGDIYPPRFLVRWCPFGIAIIHILLSLRLRQCKQPVRAPGLRTVITVETVMCGWGSGRRNTVATSAIERVLFSLGRSSLPVPVFWTVIFGCIRRVTCVTIRVLTSIWCAVVGRGALVLTIQILVRIKRFYARRPVRLLYC